jgi:hypothetical protein
MDPLVFRKRYNICCRTVGSKAGPVPFCFGYKRFGSPAVGFSFHLIFFMAFKIVIKQFPFVIAKMQGEVGQLMA